MTDETTMPDWVLIEAAKRSGWGHDPASLKSLRRDYTGPTYGTDYCYHALCDLILEHVPRPVDEAVELYARMLEASGRVYSAEAVLSYKASANEVDAVAILREALAKARGEA